MKKGFTLIELLTVIIILAIIALIATPLVLNVIKNSRIKSFISNVDGIIRSAENLVLNEELDNKNYKYYSFVFDNGNQIALHEDTKLEFKGNNPDSGVVSIDEDRSIKVAIWSQSLNICVENNEQGVAAISEDIDTEEDCHINNKTTRSTWFWANSELAYEMEYITNHLKREQVINHLKNVGINTIYLSVKNNLANVDEMVEIYGDFIKYANYNNIKIYFLEGDPAFIVPINHKSTIDDRFDLIEDFNIKMKAQGINARVEGIHYDVEFYGYPNDDFGSGFWIEGQSELAKNSLRRKHFVEFLKRARGYSNSKNLKVEYDVTNMLSKITYYDDNNIEKNILEEVLQNSDGINVMYYVTMNKFITTNNDLIKKETYRFDNGEVINVNKSTIQYITDYHFKYNVGSEFMFFRKDVRKVEACKNTRPSFVAELVPTYIDPLLANTTNLWEYQKNYYKRQLKELNKYQKENNLYSEIGISYHDVWELLEVTGFERTQVMENRINLFENDLMNIYNCIN